MDADTTYELLISSLTPCSWPFVKDIAGKPVRGMTLFGPKSLYDALLVDQNATLDEIKLAFKKRALQVHPDKGGSKEAFHLVYQALETLADPEARKKYDHILSIRKSRNMQQQRPGDVRGKKTTARKHCHPTPKQARSKKRAPNPKCKSRPRANTGSEPSPQAPQSRQAKLLIKIRDLLKQLPRDVRNDAISNEFSQKQRLILEKWMVDESSHAHGATEAAPLAPDDPNSAARASKEQSSLQDMIRDGKAVTPGGCSSLAIQPLEVFEPMRFAMPGGAGIRSVPFVPATTRKICRNKSKTDNKDKKPKGSSSGCIWKVNDHYMAGIKFDALDIHTGQCNLQTALEYLVILTSVKQKVQNGTGLPTGLEERLHAALVASAKEHGRDFQDLQVRYSVSQRASVFIGQLTLKSPCVRSVETLKKIRVFLNPFRAYARRNLKGARRFWQYSPAHLEDAWERFQEAVADAWKMAGAAPHS